MPSLFDTYLTRAALRLYMADATDESFRLFMSARHCDERSAKLWLRRYLQSRVAESGDLSGLDTAATTTINDGVSDVTAQTREVLYTQSQKPTANVAPPACQFMAVGRDRVICGGLANPYLVQLSQPFFPGEPVEWASPNNLAHTVRLPEPVTGVACPGDSFVVFTDAGVYEIPGEGPQRNGTGEFFAPRTIASDGGCIDWRSIVETDRGTFFQLDTDKLYLLGRDGPATWVGQPVRDTLEAYPIITGAVLCTATQRVVFSAQNEVGNDGVLLVYDLRRGVWGTDDVGAVDAVTEYLGRLAYVQGGIVYLENEAPGSGSGALPMLSVRTGSFRLFSAMGCGDICKIGLLGTYLGDCTVEGFISFDDGKTWTSMGTVAVTSANTELGNPVSGAALASGDPVSLSFVPKRRNVDRFALRFDVSNGTDTGGVRLHMIGLEVEAQDGFARLPAGAQR
ncbi:MAG TPA: hypothetical protein VJU61_02575 [Polyangiaceae bacterium]|nr:hypothetical protein [Polyangiaceae bacterium]